MSLRPAAIASTLLLGLSATVLPVVVPAPALAAPDLSQRPQPQPDSYTVLSSGGYALPVLDNDEPSFLSDGDLTLCGVTVDDETADALYAEIDRDDPSRVYVETDRAASGQVTFTYDVCQAEQRAAATVTVEITRLLPPTVTKKQNRRAKVLVTNPNAGTTLRFRWGNPRGELADGETGVAAARRKTVRVSRTRIYWVAYVVDQGSLVIAGDGAVNRIRRAKR